MRVCMCVCVYVCMYIYISRTRIPTRSPIPKPDPEQKKGQPKPPQLVTNPLFLTHTTICPNEIRVFRRWTSPMLICSSPFDGGMTKEAADLHS